MKKGIYQKSTANIIFNDVRFKNVFLISEAKQGCPLSKFLFSIILEVLGMVIKKEKKSRESKLERKKKNCHYLQMT